MTQQAPAHRGARPLAFLACALLALCTASCAEFFGGTPGMNPWHAEQLQQAGQMHSIEDFGRDIEPALIQVRNELINENNFELRHGDDAISSQPTGDQTLYSLNSPTIYFLEDNVDKARTAFESHLIPLGFTVTVDEQMTDKEGKLTWIVARNPTYGISASAYIRDSKRSSFHYETKMLSSDGSTDDPQQLADIPGRRPDWLIPTPTT